MRTILLLCLAALAAGLTIPMTGCVEGQGLFTDAIAFNSEAPFVAGQKRVDTPWVWLMTASGLDTVPIWDMDAAMTTQGTLSPDGTRVAYIEAQSDYLMLYDLATGDYEIIYAGTEPANPCWSPDGNTIVFSEGWGEGFAGIYTIDVESEIATPLLEVEDEQYYNPKYNRAGTKIVFQEDREGGDAILVMDADGTNVTPLATSFYNQHPAFLPDGRIIWSHEEILTQTRQGGNWDIWIMNGDGTGKRPLTQTLGDDEFYPTCTANGAFIAFGDGGSGNGDIYVARFDGANLVSPVNITADNPYPCWHPEFGRIRTSLLETVFNPPI